MHRHSKGSVEIWLSGEVLFGDLDCGVTIEGWHNKFCIGWWVRPMLLDIIVDTTNEFFHSNCSKHCDQNEEASLEKKIKNEYIYIFIYIYIYICIYILLFLMDIRDFLIDPLL